MLLCFGGVCVPLNMLVPFIVGILHKYGYLKWIKPQWFTLRFWQNKWQQRNDTAKDATEGCDEAVEAANKGEKVAEGHQSQEKQTAGASDKQHAS
ncbi:g10887 [Coccomyxa viridis]|uniref:G10887 protein n=1 Tax=Coccomyxa viridis TaxID=1274662 RepID=A0ABP1G6T7_9CHLO